MRCRSWMFAFCGCALLAACREPPATPAPEPKPTNPVAKNTVEESPVVTLPVPDPPAPAREFRLATYNINWGNADLEQVAATIVKAQPDILCLQETNAESERFLRQRLGDQFATLQFRGGRGEFAAERFGFASLHRLLGEKFVSRKTGLFGMWIAQFDVNGRTVQVANVHLQPALFSRQTSRLAALAAIGEMEVRHREEIEYFYPQLAADVPTVMAGDFNSLSGFYAPQYLIQRGFADTFAQRNPRADFHATWHWPAARGEIRLRLDYIFCNAHLRPLESRVIESDASDHFLLVTQLEWAEQR